MCLRFAIKIPFVILTISILFTLIYAGKGDVTHTLSGCDYFLVETSNGFALLEWYGGNDPYIGDIVVGAFESYGMKEIYNTTAEQELNVWVDDFWLSKEDALEKLYEECD